MLIYYGYLVISLLSWSVVIFDPQNTSQKKLLRGLPYGFSSSWYRIISAT